MTRMSTGLRTGCTRIHANVSVPLEPFRVQFNAIYLIPHRHRFHTCAHVRTDNWVLGTSSVQSCSCDLARHRLPTRKESVSRPRQTEMFTQSRPLIVRAKDAASLQ